MPIYDQDICLAHTASQDEVTVNADSPASKRGNSTEGENLMTVLQERAPVRIAEGRRELFARMRDEGCHCFVLSTQAATARSVRMGKY